MVEQIMWRSSLEEARVEAREQDKDLLVHIDNPQRDGCGVMRASTYADPRVVGFIGAFVVPVEFNLAEDPGAQIRFRTLWTPTVIYLDRDGNEHRRSYGCLDPARFVAEFTLARGLRFFHTGHFRQAMEVLEEAMELTTIEPALRAESLYWLGVAHYRVTGNAHDLESHWRTLRHDHPDSPWARKTDFYFQLENGV